jgi:hypothetical protein
VRTIYNQIHGLGAKPPTVSPYLYVSRFGLAEGSSKEVIDVYKQQYMPRILKLPEVFRGRLYEIDLEISGLGSEQRKILGDQLASQPFVTLFEISSLGVVSSESWKQIEEDSVLLGEVMNKLENVTKEKYWLDFMMSAPLEDKM